MWSKAINRLIDWLTDYWRVFIEMNHWLIDRSIDWSVFTFSAVHPCFLFCLGRDGTGKTTVVNSIFHTEIVSDEVNKSDAGEPQKRDSKVILEPSTVELEERGTGYFVPSFVVFPTQNSCFKVFSSQNLNKVLSGLRIIIGRGDRWRQNAVNSGICNDIKSALGVALVFIRGCRSSKDTSFFARRFIAAHLGLEIKCADGW